jgi:hypothetical protein
MTDTESCTHNNLVGRELLNELVRRKRDLDDLDGLVSLDLKSLDRFGESSRHQVGRRRWDGDIDRQQVMRLAIVHLGILY